MTVREYISAKLKAFGIDEANLVDFALQSGVDMEAEVTEVDASELAIGMIHTLEECIFAPRLANVSESGFSMSWDFSSLSKYYLWLCRKWGVTPPSDITGLLGIPAIIDKTDEW